MRGRRFRAHDLLDRRIEDEEATMYEAQIAAQRVAERRAALAATVERRRWRLVARRLRRVEG